MNEWFLLCETQIHVRRETFSRRIAKGGRGSELDTANGSGRGTHHHEFWEGRERTGKDGEKEGPRLFDLQVRVRLTKCLKVSPPFDAQAEFPLQISSRVSLLSLLLHFLLFAPVTPPPLETLVLSPNSQQAQELLATSSRLPVDQFLAYSRPSREPTKNGSL